ncbi:MAG: hypothetical protein APR63_01740 [Desulfuromonas sp. SDB]|nr:MAG: hypothetical protein APR63_01740 [Desulfuromonas sp. SDB]
MRDLNTFLEIEEIQKTIDKLFLRISDRFPNSGLSLVCKKLYEISLDTVTTLQWISKHDYLIRILIYSLILGILLTTVYSVVSVKFTPHQFNFSELVQTFGSALEGLAIAVAGIIFIFTFESRRKRIKVIKAINQLRCLAHIIDMHQLIKDPETYRQRAISTSHSPRSSLNFYELNRYLNYCSEMLAITSKQGFLYVQKFPDDVATNAVNDLEKSTTDLSRKIWQKIMILSEFRDE